MERKSVMVYEDIKEKLQSIKTELGLSNENDVVSYLISVYEHSDSLPKQSQIQLIKLIK
ncbi:MULTISPECIES: hypothetical protein [Paenibacillus]|uniref:hypothetical protein n=1 Tax=Paenibacillus TaxID=44249 RepID=UPI0002D7B953|nr:MULTISPECIES: hypothetical protein [Paenibacillus]MDY8025665.1 hypothetical protein [Paenibacillus polymyxa]